MVEVCDSVCYSCSACAAICPTDAISMRQDDKGFLRPRIDESVCVGCGKCSSLCKSRREQDNMRLAFGAAIKDKDLRLMSQSGGAFASIARSVLSRSGVVYGVALDCCKVKYQRADSENGLRKLLKSKYVFCGCDQSTYSDVCKDLEEGKEVLFSGTSCQVSALLSYVDLRHVDTSKLISVDLVCHGGASPLVWDKHVEFVRELNGSDVEMVDYRSKEKFGYSKAMMSYHLSNGQCFVSNNYMELYYTHAIYGDHCYECEFSDPLNKKADITVADFRSAGTVAPSFYDDNCGRSLALANTNRGLSILLGCDLDLVEVDYLRALDRNVVSPPKLGKYFCKFWRDFGRRDYERNLKKYTPYGGLLFKIKRRLLIAAGYWFGA